MKGFSRIYLPLLIAILLLVVLGSWIGSAYNPDINSLLDANGVRWGVSHILSNYSRVPLAAIIMILVGVSVVMESGWTSWLFPKNHPLLLKQLRAYTYSNLLVFILILIFVSVLLMPSSPLVNAFGEFDNSPIATGGLALLVLAVILVANMYGYLSGRLTTSADFAFAHTRLLRKYSYAFIPLFLVGQIMGSLYYTHILTPDTEELNNIIMYLLTILCFV